MHFKARVGEKLADVKLQTALKKLQGNFVKGRADRITELDNFHEIRDAAAAIRDRALAEAEREVRDLDEGLGPLDIRDSAVLKLAGTQHYALACGAIECADAIGYGAK